MSTTTPIYSLVTRLGSLPAKGDRLTVLGLPDYDVESDSYRVIEVLNGSKMAFIDGPLVSKDRIRADAEPWLIAVHYSINPIHLWLPLGPGCR